MGGYTYKKFLVEKFMSERSCEITPAPHNCLYAKKRVTQVKYGPKRRSLTL